MAAIRPELWASVALLSACAGDQPRWALQHASVEVLDGGIAGYQVWELFAARWERKRDSKHHVCAQVELLDGASASGLGGCVGCSDLYAVGTAPLETDCPRGGPTLSPPTHIGIGPVPADLDGDEPYPGNTLGWYASWDGQRLEPMGYAFVEGLEVGEAPTDTSWQPGARFILWPAYAWDLQDAQ